MIAAVITATSVLSDKSEAERVAATRRLAASLFVLESVAVSPPKMLEVAASSLRLESTAARRIPSARVTTSSFVEVSLAVRAPNPERAAES